MFARLGIAIARRNLAAAPRSRGITGGAGIAKHAAMRRGPFDVAATGLSKRFFGSYIENYYTTNHAATGFSSPLRKTFAFMVFVFQAVFTFGYLFHTNYYFTGKALPKPDGCSQLCSDSK